MSASFTVKHNDATPPRHREIEAMFSERIRRGQLKTGDRLEATDALAQEYNVGVGTMNQALAALALRGFLTRRPRIGTVVSDNWHSLIGQDRAMRSTAIYSVLVPDLRIPAFAGMVHHLQENLRAEQIHVSVFNIEGGPEVAATAITRCVDDDVDAVLLVPPLFYTIPLDALLKLRDSGIPVVMAWRSAGVDQWPLVQGDPHDVIAAPTRHLLGKGCQRIAMFKDQLVADPTARPPIEPLSCDCDPSVQLEFMRELADRQIMCNPDDILRVNHGLDALQPGGLTGQSAVVEALTDWLAARPRIDGILCTYDVVAGLALAALARLGRRVPEDVAVTGGGRLRAYSWYFNASLTSMDPDMATVAAKICSLFKRLRAGEQLEPAHVENVVCRLVEGESTARQSK